MNSRPSIRNLLVAQFFGAFNDNALRLMVGFLAIRSVESQHLGNPGELQSLAQFETTLALSVLTLPLILVSLPAGVLADRLSKRTIIVSMKGAEIGLMAAVTAFLWLFPDNIRLPLLVLGLMGAQSALFSPAKFGILPEILPHERLSSGNAHLQMWSFLAIILGTAGGGFLLDQSGASVWLVGAVLTLSALTGFVFSRGIPAVPPARSEGGLRETLHSAWITIRSRRVLGLAVAGSAFFWTVASLLGNNILVYTRTVLRAPESMSGIPLAVLGLGVGIGSLLASRLSRRKVEYGLIPLGAVLMALASLASALFSPGFSILLVLMVILGVASGLLLVPLNSLIQWKSPAERRGGIIALGQYLCVQRHPGRLRGGYASGQFRALTSGHYGSGFDGDRSGHRLGSVAASRCPAATGADSGNTHFLPITNHGPPACSRGRRRPAGAQPCFSCR